ncbi:MAG TPA: SDR family oxidoreductase [Acidimicrobiia bacterium]|nr:SDR family oxidoreductase [Acidimicrobiia bacterium]
MPDVMDGRVVLITGGNAGIGKETAVALASMGARVVFTARDAARGTAARTEIRTRSGSDEVEVMALDLARFASVRDFAKRWGDEHDQLDVLVNNAGLILNSRRQTDDGYEMTFQVNHLGPFLLTQLLRDQLVAGDDARVVNVASDAHSSARRGLDFDDLQSTRHYRGFRVYGKTKLANILFTRELARRWAGTGVTANAVHPGFVASSFGRDGDTGRFGALLFPLLKPFALSPEQGARTQVYVASAPELAGITGGYWVKSAPATPSAAAQDDAAAARLWEVSEELVG